MKHDLKVALKYKGRNLNLPASSTCDGTSYHLVFCLSS
jgi:hypothetical protein